MRYMRFGAVLALFLAMAAGVQSSMAQGATQAQGIVVRSTNDSGPDTLREALERATPGTTITFDPAVFPPDRPATIYLASALPELAQGQVSIDGSNAGVILDGSRLPRGEPNHGLLITSSENMVRGLWILHFSGHGIHLADGAQSNTIGGDRMVGAAPTGQGNVISANGEHGIAIRGPQASNNLVAGNYIGTDPAGSPALGNGEHAIMIQESAGNTVGGTATGERNVISGNGADGVHIEGLGADHNRVLGNFIGTDPSGTAALGNRAMGVAIVVGAQHNVVGGGTAEERNIISGNVWDGVFVHDPGTMYNGVSGNYIGTDGSGALPVPNGNFGVNLGKSTENNLIGGDAAGEGNVISGNGAGGINLAGDVSENVVSGNHIGIGAGGKATLGNGRGGIVLGDRAQSNRIGGTASAERNVISGNELAGVIIESRGTRGNVVIGNFIGTDLSGTAAWGGNNVAGVLIQAGASENRIGGLREGERNIISGNRDGDTDGVRIDGPGTDQNIVIGNYVGTDVTGSVAVGNTMRGVFVLGGAQHNVVSNNVISGNGNDGVPVEGQGTMYNTVSQNYIGTNSSGTETLGNGGDGLYIAYGAQHNTFTGNLIGGNSLGVQIVASGTTLNTINGNYIGVDATGTLPLGNRMGGVAINRGAGQNTIGPDNVIAFNLGPGVRVDGLDTVGNRITGNIIYDNGRLGIENTQGGNAALSPPIITYVGTRSLRGVAPPGTTVEIFSDREDEGRVFEGRTSADGEGVFTFRLPVGRFAGPHVSATATDAEGNTSQFSSPESPPSPLLTRELPGLVAPSQVSLEPKVVGTNLGLALFCVVFFGLTSTVFNRILKEFRGELLGAFRRLIPGRLTGLLGRVGASLRGMGERRWPRLLAIWVVVLLLTSLIESFLDPEVPLLGPERLGILLTLFVSAVTVGGLELGSDLYVRRRFAPTTQAEGKVQWLGVGAAVACVIVSRALQFKPGYLYGIVGAVYLLPRVAGLANSGKRAVAVLLTVLGGVFLLWIATAFLPSVLSELEPLLLTTFLIGLQGVFFELLPLGVTDGGDIWNWRRGVWFVLFFTVFFCFYHFVLNPNASDVQALQQNGVQTVLLLIVVFGLATVGLWLLFPVRLARKRATAG